MICPCPCRPRRLPSKCIPLPWQKGGTRHRRELKEAIRGRHLKEALAASGTGPTPETRAVDGYADEDWDRESASSAANTPARVRHSTAPEPASASDSGNKRSAATCSRDAASALPPPACSPSLLRAPAPRPATAPGAAGRLPPGSALLAGPWPSCFAAVLALPLLARPRPPAPLILSHAPCPDGGCAVGRATKTV